MKNALHLNIRDWRNKYANPEVQIKELFRNYNVSTELIKKSKDNEELLDLILKEYINRLDEMPGIDFVNLDNLEEKWQAREKLRSLIMFATQAVLLKENADIVSQLEQSNNQLKTTAKKLRDKNSKLQEMNKQYLNMLSFVSHELRSPLISILGFAELLDEDMLGSVNEEQRKAIQVIIRSSQSLLDMIQNYLDLARIEHGEIQLDFKPVNLNRDVLSLVFEEMQEQFQKEEMKVSVKGVDNSQIFCDPGLIRIVLNNLLSNAVKYGEKGGSVVVDIKKDDNYLKISVKNSGAGLNQKQLKKLFQKFTQVNDNCSKGNRSSGLGLYNAKYIIEKHGGEIQADSKKGEWFRISFSLPVQPKGFDDNMEVNDLN